MSINSKTLKRFAILKEIEKNVKKALGKIKNDILINWEESTKHHFHGISYEVNTATRKTLSKEKIVDVFSDVLSKKEIEARLDKIPVSEYNIIKVFPVYGTKVSADISKATEKALSLLL